jgi:biopolymer transport protein TolR
MGMARLQYLERGFRPSEASRGGIAKRQSNYYCWMDHSALLAVSLVILVAFMLNPQIVEGRHRGGADLAKSAHSRLMPFAIREDALRMAVSRDGRVYFGSFGTSYGQLSAQLRNGVRAGAEDRVYLLVDSRAKYIDVKRVLKEIGLSGVKNISFLTWPVPRQHVESQKVAPSPEQPEGVSQ